MTFCARCNSLIYREGAGADGAGGGRQRVVEGRGVFQPRQSAGRAGQRPFGRRRVRAGAGAGARPGRRVRARVAAGRGPGSGPREGARRPSAIGPERRADRLVQVNEDAVR